MSEKDKKQSESESSVDNPWDALSDRDSLWPHQDNEATPSTDPAKAEVTAKDNTEHADLTPNEKQGDLDDPRDLLQQSVGEELRVESIEAELSGAEGNKDVEQAQKQDDLVALKPDEALQSASTSHTEVSSASVPEVMDWSEHSSRTAGGTASSSQAGPGQDRRQPRTFVTHPTVKYAGAALVFIGAALGGFWTGYEVGHERGLSFIPQQVPSIGGVLKSQPDDAGGLEIPNKGSPSYEVIAGNGSEEASQAADGLARSDGIGTSEAPLSATDLLKDVTVDDPGEPIVLRNQAQANQPALNAPQAPNVTGRAGSSGQDLSASNVGRESGVISEDVLTETVRGVLGTARVSDGEQSNDAPSRSENIDVPYRVQLASYLEASTARAERDRLQSLYQNLIGTLQVVEAEVNGQLRYQIKGTKMTAAKARQACQTLKSRGGDCFVKKD